MNWTELQKDDGAELKPCPFCGSEAEIFGGPEAQETYSVWCRNARGRRHHIECGTLDRVKAIAEWNTRAPDLVALAMAGKRLADVVFGELDALIEEDIIRVRPSDMEAFIARKSRINKALSAFREAEGASHE